MNSKTARHPDAITLRSFALGRLSDADSLPIEEHIAKCDTCRELIEAEPADSLMSRLQAIGAAGSHAHSAKIAGGYEVEQEIGRGGMGVVYRARQIGLDRLVALKMLRDVLTATPGDRARFRAEAGAVSRLRHPNIVQIYEVGDLNGQPFLALEYIDGGGLNQHLAGQPLPPGQAAALVETLARAIHFAHTQGIVHRDLKPANVLLHIAVGRLHSDAVDPSAICNLQSAIPKITDFGLAKFLDAADGPTRTGEILGTPSYMAPEQVDGRSHTAGPATDVYALGAILYECLTGRPPFLAATALETLEQVRHHEPVSARVLQPRVPRDLDTIALKCLRKEPARRYAASADLADDLRRWQAGEPIRARPTGWGERWLKWARRRPAAAALVGFAIVGFGLAIAGTLMHTARLAIEIGRTDEQKRRAADHYREARQTLRHLLSRGEPSRWPPTTHPSEIYLAQIEEALSFYQAALRSDPADTEVARDMAYAHLTAATAQFLRGQSDRAAANLQSARSILEPLHAADPDDFATCRHLATCYNVLANAETRTDIAIDLHRKVLALRERLMTGDVDDADRARALAEAVHNLGMSLQVAGQLPEAEVQHRRAIALWRDIRPTSSDVYVSMSLAESLINLAVLVQQPPSRLDEATALYREADGLLLPIVDDQRYGAEIATSLAIAYLNWSHVHAVSGRTSQAMDQLSQAIQLLDKALAREPKWAVARENRAKVFGTRAQHHHMRGDLRQALADWDRAAIDATTDETRKTVQLSRAELLSRLGDHATAAAVAAELAAKFRLSGGESYNLACAFALCISHVLADQTLELAERTRRADDYERQAFHRLDAARDAGYFRDSRAVSHLAVDADLAPLRSRPAWREFERTLSH